jgi:tetratricopeptide (TPR) repeat protein
MKRALICIASLLMLVCFTAGASASVTDGDKAMKTGHFRDAAKQYESWLKGHPADADVMAKAAQAYESAKWWGQAVLWWDRYIAASPSDADSAKKHSAVCHRWIGVNYYNLGEAVAKAIKELETATDLDPQLSEAWVWLGRIYENEGRFDKAVQTLEKAKSALPDDKLVAWLYKDAKGKLDNGGPAFTMYQHGVVQYEKGDRDTALKQFRGAVSANPDFAAAHGWVARVLFEQGLFADSIPEWQAVLKLTPDNKRAVWFLSEAQRKAGAPAGARKKGKPAKK